MSPWIQQDANLPIVWCDIDCSAKIEDTDIHLFVQINGFLKVSESSWQLSLKRVTFAEPMLGTNQNVVITQETQNMLAYYMLKNFVSYSNKGDGPVVSQSMYVTFLIHREYEGMLPVLREWEDNDWLNYALSHGASLWGSPSSTRLGSLSGPEDSWSFSL